MSQEWTRRILDAIKYFRQPFIKIKNNKPNPPLLKNQPMHVYCFDIVEPIGKTKFGKIFKVTKKDQVFALKSLNIDKLRRLKILKIKAAEVEILKTVNHPFVLKLFWAFQSEKYLFRVFEFCPLGCFFNLLKYVGHLTVTQARFFIAEAILAIEYLHSFGIAYRNLKPENVFFDELGHIRICDFSFAVRNDNFEETEGFYCGVYQYVPEIIEGKEN